MIARIRIPIASSSQTGTYQVPDLGQVWRLVAVQVTLSTSATVANRYVVLGVVPKSYASQEATVQGDAQTASLTVTHEGRSGSERRNMNASYYAFPLPEIWVGGGDTIQLGLTNAQAGDVITDFRLTIEQVEQGRVIEELT